MPVVLAPRSEGGSEEHVDPRPRPKRIRSGCGPRSPCVCEGKPWAGHEVVLELVSRKEQCPLGVMIGPAVMFALVLLIVGASVIGSNFVAGVNLIVIPSVLTLFYAVFMAIGVHGKSIFLLSKDFEGNAYFTTTHSITTTYTGSDGKSHSSTTYYMTTTPLPRGISRCFVVATAERDECCEGKVQPASLWWEDDEEGVHQVFGLMLRQGEVEGVEAAFHKALESITGTSILLGPPQGAIFTPIGDGIVSTSRHMVALAQDEELGGGGGAGRGGGSALPSAPPPHEIVESIRASGAETQKKTVYQEKHDEIPI